MVYNKKGQVMRIVNNYEYNLIELYFDGKPDEITRETLKMFKWRWNPKKNCWYNKNTIENKALAESLDKSSSEMREKKIPDSYIEKYNKRELENKPLNGSLFEKNKEQEIKMMKIPDDIKRSNKMIAKKIIDIDDDSFELDL